MWSFYALFLAQSAPAECTRRTLENTIWSAPEPVRTGLAEKGNDSDIFRLKRPMRRADAIVSMSSPSCLYPVDIPSKYSAEPLVLISRTTKMLTTDVIQLVRNKERDDINSLEIRIYAWQGLLAPTTPSGGRPVCCAFCTMPLEPRTRCCRVPRRDGINGTAMLALPRMDGGWRFAPAWSCEECALRFVHYKE